MSKLRDLWEWRTIEDAAKELTISTKEEVTESDILRAALEGLLTLSVHFVNPVVARRGEVVPLQETNWILVPPLFDVPGMIFTEDEANRPAVIAPRKLQQLWRENPKSKEQGLMPLMTSLAVGPSEDQYLNLEDDIFHIRGGVWDLPLIGNERRDVESAYQQKTDGPAVAFGGINGTFVRDEKHFFQLQESYEDDSDVASPRAGFEWLTKLIHGGQKNREEAQRLIRKHGNDRKTVLEEKDRYYPAEGLPEGSVLVVRSTALRELEGKLRADSRLPEKPLDPRERATFERLIYVLANSGTKFGPNDATALQHAAERQGIAITGKGTIAKYLSAAFERGEKERRDQDA